MGENGRSSTRAAVVMILLLCVFWMMSFSVFGDEKHHGSSSMEEGKAVVGRYWDRLKVLMNRANLYIYPPNLDFRGGGEAEKPNGGGEKVQEAVANTVEKSKAAVEGSAKSAAEMAGKTVQNTKEKVKSEL